MKAAKDFLSKFKNLTPPNGAVRKAVAHAVRAVAGVVLKQSDISVSRGVAFVSCTSVERSAIRLARTGILKELYEMLPSARETVRDLR